MYMGNSKSPMQALEKRIPRNPKYANVKGLLDTGRTVRKVRTISTKEFMQRRSEIFQRMRPSTLAQMMRLEMREELVKEATSTTEIQRSNNNQDEEKIELSGSNQDEDKFQRTTWNRNDTARQDAQEKSNTEFGANLKTKISRSFLVLDVRSREEFDACHVVGAVNYGLACVHQDRVIPEMYYFKNKDAKHIIIYDDDERIASRAAKEMVEKGYENVYLLSHGLKGMGNCHPDCLAGELPLHLVKPKSPSPRSTTHRRSSRDSVCGSTRDGVASVYNGSVSGFSSTYSVSSRGTTTSKTTFSRAPRFSVPREEKQAHKETINRILGGTR